MNAERINFVLKWAGCIFCCLGALCTSLRVDPLNIWFMNMGCVSYLLWSIRIKEMNLIIVNTVLLAIYVLGLFWK